MVGFVFFFSFQNGGVTQPAWAVGLTCWLATGSRSLDDITAGLFLVIVINGAAGSSKTDDSWPKWQFKGERMKRGSGKEETFLDVLTLLGRNLEIRRPFLRNELPLASVCAEP